MANPIEVVIVVLGEVLSFVIIIDSLLSFVLSPYHPIREAFGRILQPLYAPIRRIMPSTGTFDFSPLVLLILIQVIVRIFQSIL